MKLKGEFKLKDLETKTFMKASLNPFARKNYLDKLQEHNKRIKHLANQMGATFYSVTTDKPIFNTFFEVLQ
jgi:indole-3-glycerol phosphate synthase